jgi:D-alanyl-D-alanine carboxypeptidase (penicillin-binding protein 5/6)
MNQYAERLGMRESHFQNSTGLPASNHQMSVADIATLTRAIIAEFPDYYRWYSQREFTWNNIRQPNRNGLLQRDPTFDGVKTGMTEAAGYCLVSSAKRDDMRLIAVVAGTKSMKAREDASLALINYGFNFFETRKLQAGAVELAQHRVYKARGGHAAVGLAEDLVVTLPRGIAERVEISIELAPKVFAPLTVSDRVGVLRALVDGKVLAEAPLHPLVDVPRGNIFRRIWDTILSWFA